MTNQPDLMHITPSRDRLAVARAALEKLESNPPDEMTRDEIEHAVTDARKELAAAERERYNAARP